MGRPCSTELWTIGSCQVTSSSVAGRDTWNYEMLRRRLPPAIRLCWPCPCLRIQASKSAYRRCEQCTKIFPTLALTKATQIIAINRHCHSFEATTAFSCLHHKPRSWHALHKRCWGTKSQDPAAVSTSPEQIRNVANVHATCKPPKTLQDDTVDSSEKPLKSKSKKTWFQDACVGQLLWIESGCCSDLTGKKTSPTRFFQRNIKHMGCLNTKSWIFWSSRPIEVWGLPPGRFETPTSTSKTAKLRCVVPKISGRTLEHRDRCPQNLNMTERCLSPQHRYSPHCVGQTLWG